MLPLQPPLIFQHCHYHATRCEGAYRCSWAISWLRSSSSLTPVSSTDPMELTLSWGERCWDKCVRKKKDGLKMQAATSILTIRVMNRMNAAKDVKDCSHTCGERTNREGTWVEWRDEMSSLLFVSKKTKVKRRKLKHHAAKEIAGEADNAWLTKNAK